jgi:adenylate cyclase
MTEIIFKHGGLVNKYLGDGVMAVFGSSDNDESPELNAIQAGLEMIQAVSSSSYPHVGMFQIGVGVNSGPVMAGYVGARDHLEYTVVGDTVNVAARLEGLSRPNRLFIGPITRAAISSELESTRMGEMEIRGRAAAIQVYQVLAE